MVENGMDTRVQAVFPLLKKQSVVKFLSHGFVTQTCDLLDADDKRKISACVREASGIGL